MKRNEYRPPIVAEILLKFLAKHEDEISLIGDFEEEFVCYWQNSGSFKARLWYWMNTFNSIPKFTKHALRRGFTMLKNYFKIAGRNLVRHKGISLINLSGLSIGMACCILILLYLQYELSYEKFNKNSENIYRLCVEFNGSPIPVTGPSFGPAIENDYPEVVKAVRIYPMSTMAPRVPVKYDNRQFYEENIYYADDSVFEVFTFEMISGDPADALTRSNTIVITKTSAEKYFGEIDPLGKILKLNTNEYTVTGVIEDVKLNSHLKFDMLCSFQTLYDQRGYDQMGSWQTALDYYTYIMLSEDADQMELENKLPGLIEKNMNTETNSTGISVRLFLQPLESIHLHSKMKYEISANSDITYIYIFSVIALFVLLIACINFMNLATARASVRAKEVGLRKVMGAYRQSLIRQFIGESIVFSVFAIVLALLIVKLSLPVFTSITGTDLSIDYDSMPWLIPGLLFISLIAGVAAGSYPAFFLSGFQPVKIIKGSIYGNKKGVNFRSLLVVIQFSISIALITGTSIIYKQLNFMKTKNPGFEKEHVIVLPLTDRSVIRSLDMLKEEFKSFSGITEVSASLKSPGEEPGAFYYIPEGISGDKPVLMQYINVDDEYIKTMDISILAGRSFSNEMRTDAYSSVIINETAAKSLGWVGTTGNYEGCIGKTIRGMGGVREVIGVISDFHLQSVHKAIVPLFVDYIPGYYNTLSLKVNPEGLPNTINSLRKKWKEVVPGSPFDFHFLDESYDKQFRADEKLSEIFSYFSILAIFIACLGLFGMAAFSAEQRVKEIGIRKVLGAASKGIIFLIGRDMMKLILISNAAAWPIVYFASSYWLKSFAYHTDIEPQTFIYSSLLVFLIGIITISYQSIKAASADPVESLKKE